MCGNNEDIIVSLQMICKVYCSHRCRECSGIGSDPVDRAAGYTTEEVTVTNETCVCVCVCVCTHNVALCITNCW